MAKKEEMLELLKKVRGLGDDLRFHTVRGSYIVFLRYEAYTPDQPSVIKLQGYASAIEYLEGRLEFLKTWNEMMEED